MSSSTQPFEIPIVRRIALRANIEIARHQDGVPLILTPDELEALLDAYERGGFES